jgi:ribosomal-protein-serine acetyltransferase
MGWLDKTTAVADVETFIKDCIEQNEKDCGLTFIITERDNICGTVNFHRIDKMHNTGEIGYWLSQSHSGRGIMALAVKELVRIGFEELNLNIIEIHCAEGNAKSRAVPERLGFTYEATLRQREWLYSKYVNHAIYSMLASEYRK